MLAIRHGLMAGVACAAVDSYIVHAPLPVQATNTAVAIGAGVLPDLDTVGSAVARSFGRASEALAHLVRRLSGGHREGTHTGVGEAVCAMIAVAAITLEPWHPALRWHGWTWTPSAGRWILGVYLTLLFGAGAKALHILKRHDWWREALAIAGATAMVFTNWDTSGIASSILLGTFAHAAGDMMTEHGVAWARPFSDHVFHLLPRHLRISTGHWVERYVVTTVLLTAAGLLAWHALTLLTIAHPVAGG